MPAKPKIIIAQVDGSGTAAEISNVPLPVTSPIEYEPVNVNGVPGYAAAASIAACCCASVHPVHSAWNELPEPRPKIASTSCVLGPLVMKVSSLPPNFPSAPNNTPT